jgi:hypothetical protein
MTLPLIGNLAAPALHYDDKMTGEGQSPGRSSRLPPAALQPYADQANG